MDKPFLWERVGVFGGTFDPIHNGHLWVANEAVHDLELDKVLFVVANEPWQKDGTVEAEPFHRLLMADLAISHLPWAEVSTVEIDRPGPSYMIDTLIELSAPGRELFLIVGADQIANLITWHRHKELPEYAVVHPVARLLGITSTRVRDRIRNNKPVEYLVPQIVADYITKFELYR